MSWNSLNLLLIKIGVFHINRTGQDSVAGNPALIRYSTLVRQVFAIPVLVITDIGATASALMLAFCFRAYFLHSALPSVFGEELLENTYEKIWWFPLILLFCIYYENLYQKRLPFWKEVEYIIKAVTLTVVISITVLYLSKVAFEVSRTLVTSIWFILIIILPLFRFYGKLLMLKAGIWERPVLIVGAGKTACLLAGALKREKTMGYKVVGIINDRGDLAETVNSANTCHIPILGNIEDAKSIIKATQVRDVFIAMPALSATVTIKQVNSLQPLVNNLFLIPDLFGLSLSGIEAQQFFEEQILMLNIKNRLKPLSNRLVKRTLDLIFASILLILSTPLLLVIALVIKLESKGPVFYNSSRIGQRGKVFNCHKFRTMHSNADEILEKHLSANHSARTDWENYRKLINGDPRLTRIGKILRRFSMDELPQLINIVCGEMSLVGPRPYLPSEKSLMGAWFEEIMIAKPGLTGLWQVSGRNKIDFEGRMKLGAWYVKNWSLWLDIVILLRTVRVVLKGEGSY